MKKIEKLKELHTRDLSKESHHALVVVMEKINELVDAANDINEQLKKHYDGYHCPKQTKEPERKESKFCAVHPWAKRPCVCEKEPECKHEYNSCANNERPFCGKCGRQFGDEKSAKKECEHKWYTSTKQGVEYCHHCGLHREEKKDELAEKYQAMFIENRKDCGFGTFKIPDYKEMSKMMADEARKWCFEEYQRWERDVEAYGIDESFEARLKESK